LAAAREVDTDAGDLVLFLGSSGWRWSEAIAAQALAVDYSVDDDGRTRVWVTMGRVLRREKSGFVFVDDAKTEAGMRRTEIRGEAADMILRRIAGSKPTDLIFTTKRGGRWRYEHFYNRVWARPPKYDEAPNKPRILEVAKRMGLVKAGLAPHALRHTHVGLMILAGEPLTAIQRRVGHKSIKTTSDTYGRMIDDASSEGLDRVAALLSLPAKPVSPPRALD
jgi:integrase